MSHFEIHCEAGAGRVSDDGREMEHESSIERRRRPSKPLFLPPDRLKRRRCCGILNVNEHTLDWTWVAPLCLSHLAAAWGERSWEFGAGLLLLRLSSPSSFPSAEGEGWDNGVAGDGGDGEEGAASPGGGNELRLTALLVLTECLACSLVGPAVGAGVDAVGPLASALGTLAVQGVGIASAAVLLVLAFSAMPSPAVAAWLPIAAIGCSALARLGSLGSTIATEKRWATALSLASTSAAPGMGTVRYGELSMEGNEADHHDLDCDKDDASEVVCQEGGVDSSSSMHVAAAGGGGCSETLSQVNSILRGIDLTCNLCAPIAVGWIMDLASPAVAATCIAAFNLLAFPVEAACLVFVYRRYRIELIRGAAGRGKEGEEDDVTQKAVEPPQAGRCADRKCLEGWRIYANQPIFRSAMALAVLYLSVVGFGPLMTAWLASMGMPASHVGVARSAAAAFGLLSTAATPPVMKRYGAEGGGLRFLWYMWFCIVPCVAVAVHLLSNDAGGGHATGAGGDGQSHRLPLWILVGGVVSSRFGLWGFDLCATQLLQERIVPADRIGTVNGVQMALQSAFDALAAASCAALPDPASFGYLIVGSFGSVTVAALLHTSQVPSLVRFILGPTMFV